MTRNEIADGIEEYARRQREEHRLAEFIAAAILVTSLGIILVSAILGARKAVRDGRQHRTDER